MQDYKITFSSEKHSIRMILHILYFSYTYKIYTFSMKCYILKSYQFIFFLTCITNDDILYETKHVNKLLKQTSLYEIEKPL